MSRSGRPRVGFVGLGWIGAMRLAAVEAAGKAEVAALCDPDRERLSAAARPGAKLFGDYERLLEAAGELALDGLVLGTPNGLHAEQATAALARGLAVFCQKPLAVDAVGARTVVSAACAADRLLGVDYTYRSIAGARELRRAIEAGELGRPVHLSAVFHNGYGPDKAWSRDVGMAGGGALLDLGVHLVDLVLWLTGAERVEGVAGRAWQEGEPLAGRGIDDYAALRLELSGGAVADLVVSWFAHVGRDCRFAVTVQGTEGGAELRNVGGSFYDYELARFRGRDEEIAVSEGADALGRGILDWIERLAAAPGYDPSIESAVAVAEVVDRIYGETLAG